MDIYAQAETLLGILVSQQNNLIPRLAKSVQYCGPDLVTFSDQSTPVLCKEKPGLAESHIQCPFFISSRREQNKLNNHDMYF